MLLDARGNGEDVRVEDDVLGRKADLPGEEVVGPLADRDLAVGLGRLPLLVEGHHHHRRAVPPHDAGLPEKLLLPLLEADRVDDPLPLHALQPCLQHGPPRAVDHDRHAGDVRLAGEQREELRHHRDSVEHPLVDVDVDDVGAVLDLLPGDAHGLLVAVLLDEPGERPRAGDVGPFADDGEAAFRPDLQHLEPGITGPRRGGRGHPRRMPRDRLGDRLDVPRRRSAAAADDVEPAFRGEFAEHLRHHLGGFVEPAERVRHARIGIAALGDRGDSRQVGEVGSELLRAECAVDAHAHQVGMGDAQPARLDRLGGKRAAPLEDGERRHHRNAGSGLLEHLFDGVEAALEHERVEGGLRQNQVDVSLEQGLDLLAVGRHHLVERHVAMPGVGDVAGDRELLVGGTDRAGHETGPVGRFGRGGVGRLAGQTCGGEIEFPHPVVQPEIGKRHRRRPERAGLDDVGAGVEVGRVDPANRVRLRQHQHVDAVLEVFRMVPEPNASIPEFVQAEGVHHRAHRAVEHENAFGKQGLQGFDAGGAGRRRHEKDV